MLPPERLRQIAALEGAAGAVRDAVNSVLAAAHEPDAELSARNGIDRVEAPVEAWLKATARIEEDLRSHDELGPEERADAEARLVGLALAHLAVASDVATLAPLDDLAPDASVATLGKPSEQDESGLPDRTDVVGEVLVDGRLLATLSAPSVEEVGDGQDGEEVEAGDVDEDSGDVIDDVVNRLVVRAGKAGAAVLTSLADPLAHAMDDIFEALDVAPSHIQTAVERTVRRIANLVKRLVKRAVELFESLPGDYREAANDIVVEVGSEKAEPLSARAMDTLLGADDVRCRARASLATAPGPAASVCRIRQLNGLHRRWVGPVRLVAHGVPKLWAVPIGPVPAGAVAVVVLLAYTVIVTGDQIDSSRSFVTDLWTGVVRRAGGE